MGSRNQTHCKRGHEFTRENTYLMGRGNLPAGRCCIACKKIKANEWYQRDKKRYRKSFREQIYGIGAWEYYHDQLQKQNRRCAVCGIHEQELGHALSQDHNHDTKGLRGLLCDNCNRGIGNFHENPIVLARALDYVLEWESKQLEIQK